MNKEDKLWNPYFVMLCSVAFLSFICNQLFNTTLSLHVNNLGAPETYIGLTGAAMTIGGAIFRIISGRLLDHYRRRPVMLAGLILFLLVTLVFAYTDNLTMIILLRFLQGMSYATASTALMVSVTDVLPESRMGEGMSYYGLATALTQVIGPSIALNLYYSRSGFALVADCGAGSLLLSTVLVALCGYERRPEYIRPPHSQSNGSKAETFWSLWAIFERKSVPAGIIALTGNMSTGFLIGFAVLFASKNGTEKPGMFFSISAVFVIVTRLFTGKIIDQKGSLWVFLPGFTLSTVCFVCLILSGRWDGFYYIAGALNGLYVGLTSPAINAEAVRGVASNRRGAAATTCLLPCELAYTSSALIGGVLIRYCSYTAAFCFCIIMNVISFLLSLLLFRHKDRLETA